MSFLIYFYNYLSSAHLQSKQTSYILRVCESELKKKKKTRLKNEIKSDIVEKKKIYLFIKVKHL